MERKFKFEKRRSEESIDFQGEYLPEIVTLDDLKERMRKVAGKE